MLLFALPILIPLVILTILMFLHSIRTWNQENKDIYKKINELVHAILQIGLIICYPFFVIKFSAGVDGIVMPTAEQDFDNMGLIAIFGAILGLCLWMLSAKIGVKRHPERLETINNYDVWCKEFLDEYEVVLKRKITHILPPGVVCGVIVVFAMLQFIPIIGSKWQAYGMYFIVIIGVDFAFTFIIGDLIRLYNFQYMPPLAGELFKAGLTPEELDSYASTSVMVYGFAPFLLLDFPIFAIIMLITSVADGMASMFGIIAAKRGTIHLFPKGSKKSIEGYIGGALFTIFSVYFGVWFSNFFGFSDPAVWTMELTFIIAMILTIVVTIIDLVTVKIRLLDNWLNPLVCGIVLIIILVVAGVPLI
jgi:hypothetical protein